MTAHKYATLLNLTNYTPDQSDAINTEIQNLLADEIESGGFITCSWSDRIVERGKQKFAVFGTTAYELMAVDVISDDQREFHYLPVIIDGKMFRMDPDEGSGGLLYLMKCTKRRGVAQSGEWLCSTINTGWLRADELTLSNREILDNIADEIDDGATHLTGGRPGWA